jgi:hypothetical protein
MKGDAEALRRAYSDPNLKNARRCPFCDSELLALHAIPKSQSTRRDTWRVFCPECLSHGPAACFPKHAVDRWNGDFLNAFRPSDPPDLPEK